MEVERLSDVLVKEKGCCHVLIGYSLHRWLGVKRVMHGLEFLGNLLGTTSSKLEIHTFLI